MGLLAQWTKRSRALPWKSELRAPATEEELAECEAVAERLPQPLRNLLAESNGAVLGATGDLFWTGLHILTVEQIAAMTATHSTLYGEHYAGLVTWAKAPGGGAFYLAMTPQGRIVDMFGAPERSPGTPDPRFDSYRGEWRIIARNPTDLLVTMLEADPEQPLYWLERP